VTTGLIDRKEFREAILRAVLLPVALMILLTGSLVMQIERLLSFTKWVDHSTHVVTQAHRTDRLLSDMETGLRGFHMTGNAGLLASYREAQPQIEPAFDELAKLVSDDVEQTQRLVQMRSDLSKWERHTRDFIRFKSSGDSGSATAEFDAGKDLSNSIRLGMTEFVQNEELLRNNRARDRQHATNLALITLGGLTLLLGVAMGFLSRRQLMKISSSYEEALSSADEKARALSTSDDRYRAFIERSSEGIWRYELEEPIQTTLPAEQQVEHFYRFAYLAECNDALAQIYGFSRAEEIIGARLGDLLVRTEPKNIEYLLLFIESGYRLTDGESVERDREGKLRYFSNSLTGVVENGLLLRAWGTQRDISQRKQAEESLSGLVQASVELLSSPHLDVVLPNVLQLSQRLIAADAYAIWRMSTVESRWSVMLSSGLSESFTKQAIPVEDTTVELGAEPIVLEDLHGSNAVAARKELYINEGLHAMLVVPLKINGKFSGTVTFYYREKHRFAENDVRVATAFASIAAAAIGTAELYEEQTRLRSSAEAGERRSAFIAQAAAVLASSLDYQTTLAAVARLAVPEMADWCTVDVLTSSGQLKRLAAAHIDPSKVQFAAELLRKYPPNPNAQQGTFKVALSGQAELYPEFTDDLLVTFASDDEHLRILREIGFSSAMLVPLKVHGKSLGVITMISAESGQHYTEADLAFAEVLAGRAATAIDNAILFQEAQEANRVKDEFLATLSHELRTPMTAIIGWTHLLRSGVLENAEKGKALETIERNARAQNQIIEEILDVSRIVTGKIRLNPQSTDLAPLIVSAVDSIQPTLEAKGIIVEVQKDTTESRISADADRMHQVLWNLLSNAVKFTQRDGRIMVRLNRRDDAKLELSIADTGEGISSEFLPFVFDRFRQADGSTTRHHGGLGVGLSIARYLVELHGGSIRAESPGPGKGSIFTITLPLLVNRDREDQPSGDSERQKEKPERQDSLQQVRILIVDDDFDACELFQKALTRSGAEVKTASSVAEALTLLKSWKPEMLLSDIGMPGEDGFALIEKLRSLPAEQGGSIPAASVTAYTREEDQQRAIAAGFDMHISKPVSVTELLSSVRALWTKRN
jgi:signal transduction histidine kinase/CHASE3 domain sensor protein/ActR/RegA family two-component response regulator